MVTLVLMSSPNRIGGVKTVIRLAKQIAFPVQMYIILTKLQKWPSKKGFGPFEGGSLYSHSTHRLNWVKPHTIIETMERLIVDRLTRRFFRIYLLPSAVLGWSFLFAAACLIVGV